MKNAGTLIVGILLASTAPLVKAQTAPNRDLGYQVYVLNQTVAQHGGQLNRIESRLRVVEARPPHQQPAPTPLPNPLPNPPPVTGTNYKVVSGDTLWGIARRYGVSVPALQSANRLTSSRIAVGQTLLIPGRGSQRGGSISNGGGALPGGPSTYTVRRGDSLSVIASRNGTTTRELVRINNLRSENMIHEGQVLRLRAGAGASSKVAVKNPKGSYLPPRPEKPSANGSHTVISGETLSAIARKHGTTVAWLQQANGIRDPRDLQVNQRLIVPTRGGGSPVSQPKTQLAQDSQRPKRHVISTGPAKGSTSAPAYIPAPAPKTKAPDSKKAVADSSLLSYTFQRDDTLESVAQTFAVSVEELRKINKLPAGYRASVGKQILVPTSGIFYGVS